VALRLRTRTFVIPDGPCGFRYRHAVPAGFVFQPTPVAGIEAPGNGRVEHVDASRVLEHDPHPFVAGSMGGVVGTVITPLNRRRSSPPGVSRFRILTRCLIANTGR